MFQENPDICLLQCNVCHAVSASRIPTDETLADYYSGFYESSELREHFGEKTNITFSKPQRLAIKLCNIYRSYCQDNSSVAILDFGGGDGTISNLVAMDLINSGIKKVSIKIVDYNKKLLSLQDNRIVIDRVDSLDDITGQRYELVIASAVIEHHPRPGKLLRDLLHHVKQGGIFYARTPYILPIMRLSRLMGIHVDFTYPGHLHDLSQAFWENYFRRKELSDFQILKSKPSIVETTFRKQFWVTLAAYLLKAPWFLLGKSYKYVGGWEMFVRKR
uniref:Methyltransferase domain-containing protein n=1 Tax=Candidatus Kentrum sp. SD TaxID=2126332 RepID=A0A450YD81_9GAMM|nr:MAG: Methyltransferase domain-containing protein [Candidatus Kentron sp. SD]VFK44552.1 MAG: Methyltransferase domain-containing protein [Candidatus Kentron sp. SD]